MHGLTPGPTLFVKNPDIVWAIIASMFIGNLLLLIMNLPLAGIWAKIALVPAKLLFPIILIISIIGSYSVKNSLWDVAAMFVFGIVGYVFKKVDIPLAPIVLTFVLGELMENSLLQSLALFEGHFMGFFTRPLSATLLVLSAMILIASFVAGLMKKKDGLSADVEM